MKSGFYEKAPVPYREVVAVVAAPPKTAPHLWYAPYAGTQRKAVEIVTKEGVVLYLDNEDGTGLAAINTPPGKTVPGYRIFAAASLVSTEGSALTPPTEGRVIPQPPPAPTAETPAQRAAEHNATMAATAGGGKGGGALDAARAEIAELKARLAEAEAAAAASAADAKADATTAPKAASKG